LQLAFFAKKNGVNSHVMRTFNRRFYACVALISQKQELSASSVFQDTGKRKTPTLIANTTPQIKTALRNKNK
jgi:hypothetical protein